jgi:hypothetical protein
VSNATVQAISRLDPTLRELQLSELDKISDDVVAKLLPGFPALKTLVLRLVSRVFSIHIARIEFDLCDRGSPKVGKRTVEAAAKNCKNLEIVNLSYTSSPVAALSLLTAECLELEVLKLAGVTNLVSI